MQSNLLKSAELSTRGAKLKMLVEESKLKTSFMHATSNVRITGKQCTLKQAKVLDDYDL